MANIKAKMHTETFNINGKQISNKSRKKNIKRKSQTLFYRYWLSPLVISLNRKLSEC